MKIEDISRTQSSLGDRATVRHILEISFDRWLVVYTLRLGPVKVKSHMQTRAAVFCTDVGGDLRRLNDIILEEK